MVGERQNLQGPIWAVFEIPSRKQSPPYHLVNITLREIEAFVAKKLHAENRQSPQSIF